MLSTSSIDLTPDSAPSGRSLGQAPLIESLNPSSVSSGKTSSSIPGPALSQSGRKAYVVSSSESGSSGRSLARPSITESTNISSVPSGRKAPSRTIPALTAFKPPGYYKPQINREQVEAETNKEIGSQFGARPKTTNRISKTSTSVESSESSTSTSAESSKLRPNLRKRITQDSDISRTTRTRNNNSQNQTQPIDVSTNLILQTTAEANLGATGGINYFEDNQEAEAFHRRGRIELQKRLTTLHKRQLEAGTGETGTGETAQCLDC